jgi:hypothetical protein
MNSITIHAYDNSSCAVAPIVIVGTRKDKVSDPKQHHQISTVIFETFQSTLAWASVVSYDGGSSGRAKTRLHFFPVDNTAQRDDPTVLDLLAAIEQELVASRYTDKQIPLTWFRLLDELNVRKQPCLALDDVQSLGIVCGLQENEETHCFLFFLHEMGMLMWHDEPVLREVVILDPVAYLINPATVVICKHVPDLNDPTCHELPVHKECQKKCFEEWSLFLKSAVISAKMLGIMFQSLTPQHQIMLRMLCLKFGLFVPLYDADNEVGRYIVPALLKQSPPGFLSTSYIRSSRHLHTFYMIFSPFSNLPQRCRLLTTEDLKQYTFLPGGLFERIMSKAMVWSQSTSANAFSVYDAELFRDAATLKFGNIYFSISAMPDSGCIRVDVDSVSPRLIEARLREITHQV